MNFIKKILFIPIVFSLFLVTSYANATVYNFSSIDGYGTPNDLGDLAHNYIYFWGINSNINSNETITSAKLSFNRIYNTEEFELNDVLKVFLLDNPNINDVINNVDVVQVYDGQLQTAPNEIPNYVNNKFSDYTQLFSWTDPGVANGQIDPATGVTRINGGYSFDYLFTHEQLLTLSGYLSTNPTDGYNSTFGLGFDPDCLYSNKGITFTIETANAPVPEPGTFVLLGAGLLGLGIYGRRRIKK